MLSSSLFCVILNDLCFPCCIFLIFLPCLPRTIHKYVLYIFSCPMFANLRMIQAFKYSIFITHNSENVLMKYFVCTFYTSIKKFMLFEKHIITKTYLFHYMSHQIYFWSINKSKLLTTITRIINKKKKFSILIQNPSWLKNHNIYLEKCL